MTNVTCKSLKKENDILKEQIKSLTKDFQKLETTFMQKQENRPIMAADCPRLAVETQNNLEFYSNSYDDLNQFKAEATAELHSLKSRLNSMADQVERIAEAIEEAQRYSYQYNVKITGIPDTNQEETAPETTAMCLNLFQKLGVEVSKHDIDIAHRVSLRSARAGPRPIICKFVRRVVKEKVMKERKNISRKVSATDIGLQADNSLDDARIFDHLTPNVQKLLIEAKKCQVQNHYKFCWVKNFKVYLRKFEASRPILVKSIDDLENITRQENLVASDTR